nr:MAG TPA: hypothetical protein [Caudoviricetes sp.]
MTRCFTGRILRVKGRAQVTKATSWHFKNQA